MQILCRRIARSQKHFTFLETRKQSDCWRVAFGCSGWKTANCRIGNGFVEGAAVSFIAGLVIGTLASAAGATVGPIILAGAAIAGAGSAHIHNPNRSFSRAFSVPSG